MNPRVPRGVRTVLAAVTAGLVLAACGVGGEPVKNPKLSKGKVTISFNWWGASARNERTLDAIELFEKEHPNIDVKPLHADWQGYWDRLATSTASGDMPDVNQFDEVYLASYADRGALLDLSTVSRYLDTSALDTKLLDAGKVDSTLYAVPVGGAPNAIIINTSLFKKYGVGVPDTDHWTWKQFNQAAVQLSKASDGKVYGLTPWGDDPFSLNVWARQHGGQLYDARGNLALDPDLLADYWQRALDQVHNDATPPANHILETTGLPLDQSDITTGKVGMDFIASGGFLAYQQAAPDFDFALADWPTDRHTKPGAQYLKPTMYWSAASTTKHPAEAALLIDFLTNDTRVAKLFGLDRGEPGNPAGKEAVRPTLDKAGKKSLAFSESMAKKVGPNAPITPKGASDLSVVQYRYWQQILTGETTPQKAAKAFVAEARDSIKAAR